jgi:hypothetical protein
MRVGISIDCYAASTLPKDCDPVWIATESSDIVMNPLDGDLNVQKTEIL